MSEVITIGEPVVTFAATDPDVSLAKAENFKRILGGAELNVAIGIRRLGHSVDYFSQVGTDPLGDYVIDTIKNHQIGTEHISRDSEHFTGHQLKQLVTVGDPKTFNYRKDSAASHLQSHALEDIDLSDVKFAHMSGIFPAISATAEKSFRVLYEKLHQNKIPTTFDPNLRPSLWGDQERMIRTINELATNADIVLPGVDEGEILMGSRDPEKIADFYLKSPKTSVVMVKVGAKGAFVKTKKQSGQLIPGFKVDQVVDTVGAGDGFALGVITALLEGKTLESAALRGNAVGAMQVQVLGDNEGYPTREKLLQFYEKQGVEEK